MTSLGISPVSVPRTFESCFHDVASVVEPLVCSKTASNDCTGNADRRASATVAGAANDIKRVFLFGMATWLESVSFVHLVTSVTPAKACADATCCATLNSLPAFARWRMANAILPDCSDMASKSFRCWGVNAPNRIRVSSCNSAETPVGFSPASLCSATIKRRKISLGLSFFLDVTCHARPLGIEGTNAKSTGARSGSGESAAGP